ncbi:preprotein translocase subunit SecG [Methylopila turkensis]|uniref:Protein-export membrane protein SecG n=1 Tax=Methylopila turkensis TaxID=1437816 RepID=A0A9W6JSH9_9HYPH|nr:preprotein translocase subunit SecG [Methylopila turkensis]GLK80783.1 hypothetical protein GCM10008174_25240 [Methylopila turkensis]
MQTVLIVLHLMIVLALVVVVLLQKSEGGALGIGGGGGFMAGRGQANPLTRLTAYLAAGFFATSLALTIVAGYGGGSVLDRLQPTSSTLNPANAPAGAAGPQAPLGTGQGGILPALRKATEQQQGGAGAPPQPQAPIGGAQPPSPEAAPAAPTGTPPGTQTDGAVTPQSADPAQQEQGAAPALKEEPLQAPAQATSPAQEGTDASSPPSPATPPAATEEPAKPQGQQ